MAEITPKTSVDARLDTQRGRCIISSQPLDVQEAISYVGDDSAGAIAIFIGTQCPQYLEGTLVDSYAGTTRNWFKG